MNSKTLMLGIMATLSCGISSSWLGFGQPNENHRINFKGTVILADGTRLVVDNISISSRYEDIPVYDVPHLRDRILKKSPTKDVVTNINLVDVERIEVSQPNTVWTYRRTPRLRETPYIKITVFFKQVPKGKKYLVEQSRRILGNEITEGPALKKKIPLSSIATLEITGFEKREISEQKKVKRKRVRNTNRL